MFSKKNQAWLKLWSLEKPEAKIYGFEDVRAARVAGVNEGISLAQKMLAEKIEEIIAFDKEIFTSRDMRYPEMINMSLKKELLNNYLRTYYQALGKMRYEFNTENN
jgi:hypothetical protein